MASHHESNGSRIIRFAINVNESLQGLVRADEANIPFDYADPNDQTILAANELGDYITNYLHKLSFQ